MVLWIFIVIKENIVSDSNAQIGQKLQRCKRHIAMENFMTHLQKTLLKLMLFCHVKMFLLKRAPKCKSKNSHYVGLNDEIYETCKSCMKRNLLLYRNAVVLILRKLVFLKDLTELIASLSSLNFEKVQLAHEPNPDFTVKYVMSIFVYYQCAFWPVVRIQSTRIFCRVSECQEIENYILAIWSLGSIDCGDAFIVSLHNFE